MQRIGEKKENKYSPYILLTFNALTAFIAADCRRHPTSPIALRLPQGDGMGCSQTELCTCTSAMQRMSLVRPPRERWLEYPVASRHCRSVPAPCAWLVSCLHSKEPDLALAETNNICPLASGPQMCLVATSPKKNAETLMAQLVKPRFGVARRRERSAPQLGTKSTTLGCWRPTR